jgi:uncharacterized cupin superfamily protein
MPKLDPADAPLRSGTIYPAPYDQVVAGRTSRRLGDLAGLTQFGANLVTLAPGANASMRHWHAAEDEFAVVMSGALVLVEDGGETPMGPGDFAGWKAGVPNGHRFENRSDAPASFLVVGTKAEHEVATYSDVDFRIEISQGQAPRFTYRDGTPWEGPR